MNRIPLARIGLIGAIACALALFCALITGCAGPGSSAVSERAQANRAYMSQVNETMDKLSSELDSFKDAVARGDVVNTRTQANNAFKELDKLAAIEAPDDFSDVHAEYIEGVDKMRDALNSYIDLFTESKSESFDWSTYDSRIEGIQKQYDEGVEALGQADKDAASVNGGGE